MKFIYFLLPLVSSALADSLITCPCDQQDCSIAADKCACENQNIVNKYFCCDANTAAPQNLSLQDCNEGTLSANKVHIPLEFLRGLCGGPHDLSCSDPHDTCKSFPGNPIDHPLTWGLCLPSSYPGIPFSNHSWNSIDSATSTVFVTSTVSASSNKSSSSSSSAVTISTSTISVTSVFSASSSNSSSSPSVPVSTLTVVETTTATSAVKPSTPVTVVIATAVATTTTFTTSTKSSPSATATTTTTTSTTSTTSKPSATATTITTVYTSIIRPRSAAAIACGGAEGADCPEGYHCDNGGKCPGTMTAFMGWDCSGTCMQS